jgi:hypothetical protein
MRQERLGSPLKYVCDAIRPAEDLCRRGGSISMMHKTVTHTHPAEVAGWASSVGFEGAGLLMLPGAGPSGNWRQGYERLGYSAECFNRPTLTSEAEVCECD